MSEPLSKAPPKGRVVHPNREKPASHMARMLTVVLLLASAAVLTIVAAGGWDVLEGGRGIQVFYIIVYVLFAFFVARWNRGVLPVAASLAVILMIFAGVAAPDWYSRDKTGFEDPALSDSILGTLTLLTIPLQLVLIAVSMWAFSQKWNVEVELDKKPEKRLRGETGYSPAGA